MDQMPVVLIDARYYSNLVNHRDGWRWHINSDGARGWWSGSTVVPELPTNWFRGSTHGDNLLSKSEDNLWSRSMGTFFLEYVSLFSSLTTRLYITFKVTSVVENVLYLPYPIWEVILSRCLLTLTCLFDRFNHFCISGAFSCKWFSWWLICNDWAGKMMCFKRW
jgi:hypothetical protein